MLQVTTDEDKSEEHELLFRDRMFQRLALLAVARKLWQQMVDVVSRFAALRGLAEPINKTDGS